MQQKSETSLLEQLDRKYREIRETIQSEQDKLQKIELDQKGYTCTEKMKCSIRSFIKVHPRLPGPLPQTSSAGVTYAEGPFCGRKCPASHRKPDTGSSDTFSIYHDREYKETDVDVEICAPVKKPGKSTEDFVFRLTEPVPSMACTMVYGPFSNIAGAYLSFGGLAAEKSSASKWQGKADRLSTAAHGTKRIPKNLSDRDTDTLRECLNNHSGLHIKSSLTLTPCQGLH